MVYALIDVASGVVLGIIPSVPSAAILVGVDGVEHCQRKVTVVQ